MGINKKLYEAVNNDDLAQVKKLLERGADPNKVIGGESLLHIAVNKGDKSVEKVKLLIEYGANINQKNKYNQTPLYNSFLYNTKKTKLIKLLLENGANPNIKDNINGDSPLLSASMNGTNDIDELKLLLEYGADPNIQQDRLKITPLHLAIGNYLHDRNIFCFECIKLLIDHGADINIKDFYGRKPLDIIDNKELRDSIEEYANVIQSFDLKQPDEDYYYD